ncbi:hypothetical protein [Paenibacillus pini]|uniref:hypothetical protein n=1 Tax=Paenibacillus pini TaxID=669461 RepID=UPI001F57576F|nr:hypothetical protein [Paenibacillus pini]
MYSITGTGQEKFFELLRNSLVHVENVTPTGDIGLMFIDHLPKEVVCDLLEMKLKKIQVMLHTYSLIPDHGKGSGVNLSFRHRIALLKCDHDWLEQTILELRNQ